MEELLITGLAIALGIWGLMVLIVLFQISDRLKKLDRVLDFLTLLESYQRPPEPPGPYATMQQQFTAEPRQPSEDYRSR